MADDATDTTEKTEDPTQKRLDEALNRGDVVKSQEVSTWFVIAGAALVLSAFSGGMGSQLTATMRGLIANSYYINMDGPALPRLFEHIGVEIIAAVAIPFLLLMLAALGGNLIQHKLVWSVEQLAPKLSKISPAAGFKRLFSQAGARQFRQGPRQARAGRHGADRADVARARPHHGARARRSGSRCCRSPRSLALKLLGAVVAMMAVVAIADYLFQYRQWFERQKMSLREMKEEFKQSEGDPTIKGKLKQMRAIPACASA